MNVKEVTEEFLDVQARLKTKKELEKRYLDLLKKANTVNEILEVEREIGKLRSDIESVEGRLNYLENKVSLSTISITFYKQIRSNTKFAGSITDAFRNGWDMLIWLFVFLITIWPLIILAAGAFLVGKKW